MLCKNCGKEIDDKAVVCIHCGEMVKGEGKENQDGPIGGLGVLCFLIPLLGFILYLIWKKDMPLKARGAGKAGLWGLIIVMILPIGISVAVGVQMFNTQATAANRQAVIGDLQQYGSKVMQYYRTPAQYGGGGGSIETGDVNKIISFMGWEDNPEKTTSGSFKLSILRPDLVEIVGEGFEKGNDRKHKVSATLTIDAKRSSPLSTTVNN